MFILNGIITFTEEYKDFISAIGVLFTLFLGIISFSIARKLYQIENKRDLDIIKDNAVVVYYDILLGLMDIIRLSHSEGKIKPKRLYFSESWIKDVSYLRAKLGANIDRVYLLYGDLIAARETLEIKDYNELNGIIHQILNKVFTDPKTVHTKYIDGNLKHLETLMRWEYQKTVEDVRTIYEDSVMTIEENKKFKKALKKKKRK